MVNIQHLLLSTTSTPVKTVMCEWSHNTGLQVSCSQRIPDLYSLYSDIVLMVCESSWLGVINILHYLIIYPWRTCSLSRGSTALRSPTPRSAPGLADPWVAWVCGPGPGSHPGCPGSCSPRTAPPTLPEAWCRTERSTTPRKRARWSWWDFLNCSSLLRCLDRRDSVFLLRSARFPSLYRLRGSGLSQNWWVRGGPALREDSVSSLRDPSPPSNRDWSKGMLGLKTKPKKKQWIENQTDKAKLISSTRWVHLSLRNPDRSLFWSIRVPFTKGVLLCRRAGESWTSWWWDVTLCLCPSARQDPASLSAPRLTHAPRCSITLDVSLAGTEMTDCT